MLSFSSGTYMQWKRTPSESRQLTLLPWDANDIGFLMGGTKSNKLSRGIPHIEVLSFSKVPHAGKTEVSPSWGRLWEFLRITGLIPQQDDQCNSFSQTHWALLSAEALWRFQAVAARAQTKRGLLKASRWGCFSRKCSGATVRVPLRTGFGFLNAGRSSSRWQVLRILEVP